MDTDNLSEEAYDVIRVAARECDTLKAELGAMAGHFFGDDGAFGGRFDPAGGPSSVDSSQSKNIEAGLMSKACPIARRMWYFFLTEAVLGVKV